MTLDKNWFSEIYNGYALSLEIKDKLHEERSAYQKIIVYETTSFGYLMTLDDVVMLTSRDNFIYHEMMAHPILFSHKDPKNVVVVGGGDCGTITEVLKHETIDNVIQIELDPRVTKVAEKFFPELCCKNNDPRAKLLFQDAIMWMQEDCLEHFDIIILDTTDPVGQAKRLFVKSFYLDCMNALRDGGMIVAQSESPILDMDIIKGIHEEMKLAGFLDITTFHFPLPTYPSGWWTATMARKGRKFDGFREADVRNKSFKTKYYNADIHRACIALPEFMMADGL